MSIGKVKMVFENIEKCENLHLELLRIKIANGGIYYAAFNVPFTADEINKIAKNISNNYCGDKKLEDLFDDVLEYNGSADSRTIYKLKTSNPLIKEEYAKLKDEVDKPRVDDPLQQKVHAFLLKGEIKIDEKKVPIKLFSIQNPIVTLKNKFIKTGDGNFKEITDKVLSLKTSVDVAIVEDVVYMLSLSGEKLFDMERAYKKVCVEQINAIEKSEIINDFDFFKEIASSGHNPRRFVSFNEMHLKKLKKKDVIEDISKKFNIPLDGERFNVNDVDSAEKLIKLLCDKGMVDPFDESPMEVSNSKKWE